MALFKKQYLIHSIQNGNMLFKAAINCSLIAVRRVSRCWAILPESKYLHLFIYPITQIVDNGVNMTYQLLNLWDRQIYIYLWWIPVEVDGRTPIGWVCTEVSAFWRAVLSATIAKCFLVERIWCQINNT